MRPEGGQSGTDLVAALLARLEPSLHFRFASLVSEAARLRHGQDIGIGLVGPAGQGGQQNGQAPGDCLIKWCGAQGAFLSNA